MTGRAHVRTRAGSNALCWPPSKLESSPLHRQGRSYNSLTRASWTSGSPSISQLARTSSEPTASPATVRSESARGRVSCIRRPGVACLLYFILFGLACITGGSAIDGRGGDGAPELAHGGACGLRGRAHGRPGPRTFCAHLACTCRGYAPTVHFPCVGSMRIRPGTPAGNRDDDGDGEGVLEGATGRRRLRWETHAASKVTEYVCALVSGRPLEVDDEIIGSGFGGAILDGGLAASVHDPAHAVDRVWRAASVPGECWRFHMDVSYKVWRGNDSIAVMRIDASTSMDMGSVRIWTSCFFRLCRYVYGPSRTMCRCRRREDGKGLGNEEDGEEKGGEIGENGGCTAERGGQGGYAQVTMATHVHASVVRRTLTPPTHALFQHRRHLEHYTEQRTHGTVVPVLVVVSVRVVSSWAVLPVSIGWRAWGGGVRGVCQGALVPG